MVIRKEAYIWDRNKISNHSGRTLSYASGSNYSAQDGYGYFIQNDRETLDQQGEWYYNGTNFYMYFGSNDPEDYDVSVSSRDQLVMLDGINYVTIDNVAFEGANTYALQIRDSEHITIQNCIINFTGNTAIFGPWWGSSSYCKIANNTISNSNNTAITLSGDHDYASVTGNSLRNTGIIIGMGESGDGTYTGLAIRGANSTVQYNTVENTGYVAINFAGNNILIANNLVNTFNLVKNDGGGIYTYVGTGTSSTGQKVTGNIVLNGMGYGGGTPDNEVHACGIYTDDRTRNVVVSANTMANCSAAGLYLHNAHEIEIYGNTLYNNGSGRADFGSQLLFVHDSYSPDDPIRNIEINDNILFARAESQLVIAFSTFEDDISSFGTADYNCYAKPINNSLIARTWSEGWHSTAVMRSLSGWQSFTGEDENSYISPISVNDVNKIRFEYNGTNSNKVVSLDGSYMDVRGTSYSGTITLLPYTSAVLMVDPNPPAPPANPVYVSSAVENSAPSVIEMTYNLSLANIVPAISAFSVRVNSAARTVNSVSVSGTKVSLTLASPVAYGNTVTVAYTAPSANPLQTPAGGKASSINAQSVTNRVNATPLPPTAPVYVNSAVENAAPSVIEMIYNLSLANIVPAASSFSVRVNSAARGVSSVSISGTKVLLTLASPVASGNTVTIAYTKPSANPLQTPAGGQAATIGAQSVTNRVNAVTPPPVVVTPPAVTPNTPPVVVVNYHPSTYSGFEDAMNATGSYDLNNDKLAFTWIVPNNVPVSSLNGAIIRFLGPIVETSQKIEFTLKVSDGKITQTKIIPIEILPYQPELKAAEIVKVEASGFQSPYYPYNILDGDIGTIWSANGDEQWIVLELKEPFNIQHIKLSFLPGQNNEAYFDILGSEDKEHWETILAKSKSCAFSGNLQVFDFPPSKTGKEFRFIKLIGRGNAINTWNYISEFRIFGLAHRNPTDYDKQIVKVYPNPARAFTNIIIEEQSFIPDFVKVVSLAGKIVFHDELAPGIRDFQIPLNLKQGIYILQMGTGQLTNFTQKIVVAN